MNKLDGIKPGDRVRVTFEGEWSRTVEYKDGAVIKIARAGLVAFDGDDINAPTFQIERIEPPVQIGDLVTWGSKTATFKLVAIEGDMGIMWNGSYATTEYVKNLIRA